MFLTYQKKLASQFPDGSCAVSELLSEIQIKHCVPDLNATAATSKPALNAAVALAATTPVDQHATV